MICQSAPSLAGRMGALILLTVLLLATAQVQAGPARVYAWGDNFYGQTNLPVSLTNVVKVAGGYYHALALHSNGTVSSWGQNLYGQTNNQASLTNIIAIAGGGYHSLALRSNGTVYGWGLNSQGQRTIPPTATGVKAISAGSAHSMALRTNGIVVAWGGNTYGQTSIPPGLTNVVAISAGDNHCLALRNNGTVVGWGEDFSGQATVPSYVTNIMAIAAGYHHNLAVRSNGTLVAWGVNVYGEASIPPGLSNVVAIAAGYFHSAALRSDGTVVAWGQEFSGVTNLPVGLNSVSAIAAGWEFGLALSTAPLCPPGFPDLFECREIISGSSISNFISNVGSTREIGEPLHGGAASSNSIWYSWTAPSSGSVVIEARAGSEFASPLLAVFTGNSLASLSNVAFNFGLFNGQGSPLNKARVAFTAVSNQTYVIAVDGAPPPNIDYVAVGNITFTLTLTPPPTNDLFANAIAIPDLFYEITNATFRGASKETGEPAHGDNFAQTLWWTWTAPTNLGVAAIPVRLSADAANHPPAIAVYTGNSASTLTPIPTSQAAYGMSRTATFTGSAGTTYHFAIAGLQNDTESVLPLMGNFRFRFNTRALGLTINNVITNTISSTQAVNFTAIASITNLGTAASGPLRVLLTSIPGISMRGPDVLLIDEPSQVLTSYVAAALSPGQFTNLPIAGVAPAPAEFGPGTRSAEGFGVYAALQEQSGTNWITVDETLVVYGNWPEFEGLAGPGGGVIRLDPGFVGLSAFNPLAAVTTIGPPTTLEGSQVAYFGQARYANNAIVNFTNTTWLATLFSITNGLFRPGIVNADTPVTLTAKYSASGFVFDTLTNVTVINLPSPSLTLPTHTSGNFTMRVAGVSNRVHVIETTTNLSPPQLWVPFSTNTLNASGVFNFTNAIGAAPQRFYRAREVE